MPKNVISMQKIKLLTHLQPKKKARIVAIQGGRQFNRKMCVMNLRVGQIVEVVSKQPFMGPLTISIGNCKMTIGRGMAHKIHVEEL
jgi:ferrous iron transport protein A